MNVLFDELVKRAEYQLKCINETRAIKKIEDIDYVETFIKHTIPDLLLEIKWLKRSNTIKLSDHIKDPTNVFTEGEAELIYRSAGYVKNETVALEKESEEEENHARILFYMHWYDYRFCISHYGNDSV